MKMLNFFDYGLQLPSFFTCFIVKCFEFLDNLNQNSHLFMINRKLIPQIIMINVNGCLLLKEALVTVTSC